jgi:hypothetical protein
VNNQYLTIWDLVLTPVYLGLLIFIAKRHRDRKYPVGHPLRNYYLPGLYVKFFGAIFIGLIYQFYYHGGDTFNFYTDSRIMNSSLDDSFSTWIKLLFRKSPDTDPKLFAYTSQMNFYRDPASHMVSMIGALFGILSFTSYMPIALLFAFFSYTGIWALYRTFTNIYPGLIKPLAIAVLFIPSTFVWGSAIFKDTICMFGLGWMVYTTFRIFINRDFSIKNIFLLVLSFYLVAVVKLYIILAFMPALCIWILMSYSHKIKSSGARFIVSIMFVGVTVAGFIFFANLFAEDMKKYSLENLSKTAEATRGYIIYATGDEGSVYDIGEFDGTIGGTLKKFPAGVIVTLFRPFPWEAGKVIVALSALEALAFLYFTLKIFVSRKTKLSIIFKNPTVLFCLIFSLIFAFSVGISAGNFGTLSRYKIPCLPFYGAFLMICLNYREQKFPAVKSGKQLQKAVLVSGHTV